MQWDCDVGDLIARQTSKMKRDAFYCRQQQENLSYLSLKAPSWREPPGQARVSFAYSEFAAGRLSMAC